MPRTAASNRLAVRNLPYSLLLDGNGDAVTFGVNYPFERTDTFSAFGYARPSQLKTSEVSALFRKADQSSGQGWGADKLQANTFRTIIANGALNRLVKATTDVFCLDQWHFWGFNYDGSSAAAGLNLILVEVGKALTGFNATTLLNNNLSDTIVGNEPLYLGAVESNTTLEWVGYQTMTGVANTQLSLTEFQDLYYHGKIPASTQSLWLGEATDGSGTTLTDEIAAIDGTLQGTTGSMWSTASPLKPRTGATARTVASARSLAV